jgi:hypothetical protein
VYQARYIGSAAGVESDASARGAAGKGRTCAWAGKWRARRARQDRPRRAPECSLTLGPEGRKRGGVYLLAETARMTGARSPRNDACVYLASFEDRRSLFTSQVSGRLDSQHRIERVRHAHQVSGHASRALRAVTQRRAAGAPRCIPAERRSVYPRQR